MAARVIEDEFSNSGTGIYANKMFSMNSTSDGKTDPKQHMVRRSMRPKTAQICRTF